MLSLVTLFIFGVTVVFAGNKTEKFKVYGNCGMCESRIEKAAKSVTGILNVQKWLNFKTLIYAFITKGKLKQLVL